MRLFLLMRERRSSYNKREKLKSRKQLHRLFAEGKTFIVFPVKVFYELNTAQDNVLKTGVGVSRKNFKRAVERNRIKRLLREAYRTGKTELYDYLTANKKKIALFFLYIDKNEPDYTLLTQAMQHVITNLINEVAS